MLAIHEDPVRYCTQSQYLRHFVCMCVCTCVSVCQNERKTRESVEHDLSSHKSQCDEHQQLLVTAQQLVTGLTEQLDVSQQVINITLDHQYIKLSMATPIISRDQFQIGLKSHLFKCVYLQDLLRSELTY